MDSPGTIWCGIIRAMIFEVFDSASAPQPVLDAAAPLVERFGVQFATYYVLPDSGIRAALSAQRPDSKGFRVYIASEAHKGIVENIEILTRVANGTVLTTVERAQFLEALLSVYGFMDVSHLCELVRPDLLVAPKREGATLAKLLKLNCLIPNAFFPDAKRIHSHEDLIVGLTFEHEPAPAERCVIVDGAIGSGATLFAIMHQLHRSVRSFTIYSVHATMQGLAILCQFAKLLDRPVDIHVGHVSGQLDGHYYAREDWHDGSRLVVGDLGDTIANHIE